MACFVNHISRTYVKKSQRVGDVGIVRDVVPCTESTWVKEVDLHPFDQCHNRENPEECRENEWKEHNNQENSIDPR